MAPSAPARRSIHPGGPAFFTERPAALYGASSDRRSTRRQFAWRLTYRARIWRECYETVSPVRSPPSVVSKAATTARSKKPPLQGGFCQFVICCCYHCNCGCGGAIRTFVDRCTADQADARSGYFMRTIKSLTKLGESVLPQAHSRIAQVQPVSYLSTDRGRSPAGGHPPVFTCKSAAPASDCQQTVDFRWPMSAPADSRRSMTWGAAGSSGRNRPFTHSVGVTVLAGSTIAA